jgi:hypothetical protein
MKITKLQLKSLIKETLVEEGFMNKAKELGKSIKRQFSELWQGLVPWDDRPFRILDMEKGNPLSESLHKIVDVNAKKNEVIVQLYNPEENVKVMTYDDYLEQFGKGAYENNKGMGNVAHMSWSPEDIENFITVYKAVAEGQEVLVKFDSSQTYGRMGEDRKGRLGEVVFAREPGPTLIKTNLTDWPDELDGYSVELRENVEVVGWQFGGATITSIGPKGSILDK